MRNLIIPFKGTFIKIPAVIFLISLMIIYSNCSNQKDKLKRLKEQSPIMYANYIASNHLKQLQSLPDFNGLRISKVYPIYYYGNETQTAYEFKLESPFNYNNGYIIVNLDQDKPPILEFSSQGKTTYERFREKTGNKDFRVCWFTPTYTIAVDSLNNVLASFGDFLPDSLTSTITKDIKDKSKIHKVYWEQLSKKQFERKDILIKQWKQFDGTQTWSILPPSGPVDDHGLTNYVEWLADGYERAPDINQILRNIGVNNKECSSGCGAAAWMNMIVYHDLMWSPYLLPGSQNHNGDDGWGNRTYSEYYEPVNYQYVDRLTMDLAKKLDTECHGTAGYVARGDIEKGFDFITENLNHSLIGKNTADEVRPLLRRIEEYQRPAVIWTDNHYSLAIGFVENRYYAAGTDSWDPDMHYIKIIYGHGVKYMASSNLKRYWYFQNVSATGEALYDVPIKGKPSIVTTRGLSLKKEIVWVFWLGEDQKIHYMTGNPTNYLPALSYDKIIDVKSIFPPSVTTNGVGIYLAYVDEDHNVQLMTCQPPSYADWVMLPSPKIRTDVQPSICGSNREWFTIGFSNYRDGVQIISTDRSLQRDDAWPESYNRYGEYNSDFYYSLVNLYGSEYPLSIVKYDTLTVLSYKSPSSTSTERWPVSLPSEISISGERTIIFIPGLINTPNSISLHLSKHNGTNPITYHKPIKNKIQGAPSLCVSNKTLFFSYKSIDNRVFGGIIDFRIMTETLWELTEVTVRDYLDIYDISEIFRLDDRCRHYPVLGAIEAAVGRHPLLLGGWIDQNNILKLKLMSVDCEKYTLNYDNFR